MFTILVVASPAEDVDDLGSRHPSVEVLRAHGADEAVEKLGRNRRIDAVLILESMESSGASGTRGGLDAAGIAREIREENPAPPPVFAVAPPGTAPPAGCRGLLPAPPGRLLQQVIRALEP